MTTNPSDESQVPGNPAPPPPPSTGGYQTPPAATPPPAPSAPPAGGYAPPPAGGYGTPPAGGYGGPPPAAPGYGAPTYGAAGAPLSDADQRLWATLAHIGGVIFSVIAPLIVWLVHKGRGAFVEEQAKEALNFQILVLIAYFAGGILSVIGIGVLIIIAAWIAALVFGIMAAVATNRGEAYRYPLNWRIVK